ncbi:MAG: hypothetical protein Q7S86_01525 [bacterium]|nr:hypothetical protein [bacterium]
MNKKENNTYSFEETKKIIALKIDEYVLQLRKDLKKGWIKQSKIKAKVYA